MNRYEKNSLAEILRKNSYPGRGLVCGKSADGTKAVTAYFIMGRSENSRNRIFAESGDDVKYAAAAYFPPALLPTAIPRPTYELPFILSPMDFIS